MNTLPRDRLEQLSKRFVELDDLLCQPDVLSDRQKLSRLNKERAEIEPIVNAFSKYRDVEKKLAEDQAALADPELRELAQEEIPQLLSEREGLEASLRVLLLPVDPNDSKNTIVEIRQGEGGEEAALFAADLFRMYNRWAEKKGWKIDVVDSSPTGMGGFDKIEFEVHGEGAYSRLKFEGGVHRVQRVPKTEAQGRIHTSAATVAVMPEADPVEVELKPEDLEIKASTSTGPGGQSVNTTYSAIRIVHKPTGLVVSIQDEKSQLQNKEKALRVLRARLYEMKLAEQQEAMSAQRRGMVRSGNRSEKIRTYNFKENRVTDHRIGLTLHKLDLVMNGELDELVTGLITAERAAQLNGGAPAA